MVSRGLAACTILTTLAAVAACGSSTTSDDGSPADPPDAGTGGGGGSTSASGSGGTAASGGTGGGGAGGAARGAGGGGSAGQTAASCVDGRACSECPSGQARGMTACNDGVETCVCEVCAPLEVVKVPASNVCGGDPKGTWRLVDFQAGTGTLYLAGGTCDVTLALDSEAAPRILLDLADGTAVT